MTAHAAAADKLRDPTSALFYNVTVGKSEYGGDAVCGEVTGKNAFGGYGGKTRFTYHPGAGALIEPDENPFPELRPEVSRTQYCVFDIQYRTCKGEADLPNSIASCMAYLPDTKKS